MTNPFGNYPSKNIEKREIEANRTPRGLTKEILAWVGDDKERAQRALDQEKADEKPRVTVIKALEAILND